MKFKKLLAVLMATSMLALTACGGSESSSAAPESTPAEPASVVDASEPAGDVEVRTFKLADNHPDGYPTVLGDLKFAELVEERTNGAIKIEVFNNAALGDEKVTIEQTQMGDIQFIRVGTAPLAAINPVMNALTMPYLYRDKDHLWSVLDGEIGDEFLEAMYDNGLLGLCWFDAGSRNFYNSQKEVSSPADLVGLKIRVQETPLMMDLVSALGGAPTPMPYDEVYSGIQNGIIHGAENNWPSYMTSSHSEVAKYITEDEHTIAPEMILVNTATWESFTAEEQEILKQAALEAAEYQRGEWARQENEYKQAAIDAGSIVTTLTAEEKAAFADAVASIYEQDDYAAFDEIIKRIQAA